MSSVKAVLDELDELRRQGHVSHEDLVFQSQSKGPSTSFENIIFVDNIPKVEAARVEKLMTFTRKAFEKVRELPLCLCWAVCCI
jgi:hypothetical protein